MSTIDPMMRLRATLERGLRHRWLWLAFALVLAVLLTLLMLHSAGEALVSGLVVCAMLALLMAARQLVPSPPARPGTRQIALRGPPLLFAVAPAPAGARHSPPPLRL